MLPSGRNLGGPQLRSDRGTIDMRLAIATLVVLLLGSVFVEKTTAQADRPLFDYISAGVGLNIYQGDLDANPEHDLIKYLSSGNVNVLLGVERRYGKLGLGAQLNYNRFTVERFRDELGDWRICILTPFGARVHAPWGLALQARLSQEAGFEVQAMWSDDGVVLTNHHVVEQAQSIRVTLSDGRELPAEVVARWSAAPMSAPQRVAPSL